MSPFAADGALIDAIGQGEDAESLPLTVRTIAPSRHRSQYAAVRALLASHDLGVEDDVELYVVALRGRDVVGCLGLAGNVVKGAAITEGERGTGVAARLVQEMNYVALDRGRHHLFCFTRPANREIFSSLGFHPIAEVPGTVVLLENKHSGLADHCARLRTRYRRPGERVGAIVVNANPFTLGHQHLIATAAEQCDVLHVAVVEEDISEFAFADRLALVRAGCADLPAADRIVIRPGGPYVVSRATFPSYFLRDTAAIVRGAAGLDLQLFRNHIAPALGITHRFVGTEPLSAITALYNDEMRYWLGQAPLDAPPIEVRVLERITHGGEAISASRVRDALAAGRLDEVRPLVPPSTFDFLTAKERA